MKGGKFTLGLIHAAAVLVVALITVASFFPYQALQKRLEHVVRQNTGHTVRLSGLGYSPALGMGADKALLEGDSGKTLVSLSGIDMQWRPWALFTGEQRFRAQADLCAGRIMGVVRFSSLFLRDSGAGSLRVKDLSLADCTGKLPLGPVQELGGVLQGRAGVQGLRSGARKISGNCSLQVKKGEIAFQQGVLKGLAVEEASLQASLRKEGPSLRISGARLKSPGVRTSLSGEVRLGAQLKQSDLDLETELSFHPGRLASQPDNAMIRQALARKDMQLAISGTAGSPRVQMQ